MGAPCINLKLIIEKLSRKFDKVALRHSVLFILPSVATTLASFILFFLLKGFDPGELNSLAVTIMLAVIAGLVITAGIQFTVYRIAGNASLSKELTDAKSRVRRAVLLGIIFSIVLSVVVSSFVYPLFTTVLGLSTAQFFHFAILLTFYSIIWVLTTSFWAWGQYKSPALIFTVSYFAVFLFSYTLYRLDAGYTIYGYVGGIGILLVLLSYSSWGLFKGKHTAIKMLDALQKAPKLIYRDYWGILYQTFIILAIFLDKIVVWIIKGVEMGNGLQIIGPYTTGAFLGLVPTFSVIALAYFAERAKALSKDLYLGTLKDIHQRTEEFKQSYRRGLLIMSSIGLALLVAVVAFSVFVIGDSKITMIVLTVATGVLFFEIVLYNSFVLPIFNKTHISVIALFVLCLAQASTAFFVSHDIWYASAGFLVGSFVAFLISHFATTKLLSEFDYNAFSAFQFA